MGLHLAVDTLQIISLKRVWLSLSILTFLFCTVMFFISCFCTLKEAQESAIPKVSTPRTDITTLFDDARVVNQWSCVVLLLEAYHQSYLQ